MQSAGMTDEQIDGRLRMLRAGRRSRARPLALKEHFVLQKIAEVEKIEIDDDDIDDEIERIADQYRRDRRARSGPGWRRKT